MGRIHEEELAAIPSTLARCNRADVTAWRRSLACAAGVEAVIIGSGGTYSAACLLAQLHVRHTSRLAIAVTPLEFMAMEPTTNAAIWLISAGGANKDILAAFDAAISRQFHALLVLCGNPESPLVARAQTVEKAEVLDFEVEPDGFLATNSLVAFFTLMLRLFDEPVLDKGTLFEATPDDHHLLERDTLIVLYEGWLKSAAVDLESRFSEAALGNVQICDYRNFAHGRHHWLAKRGNSSAVLALVTPASQELASETLREIPAEVSSSAWTFERDGPTAALQGLLRSISFAATAARRIGLDPGRPGVPDFGHRIYEMGPTRSSIPGEESLRRRAIERKAGFSIARLERTGRAVRWTSDYTNFVSDLSKSPLGGVVMDFDGTMVATKRRFDPLCDSVRAELSRLLEQGMRFGIATGRGKSVWRELREAISEKFWNRITIGYYNGSVVRLLSDGVSDIANGDIRPPLARCHAALAEDADLRESATVDPRPTQVTVTGRACGEDELWSMVSQVLDRAGVDGIKVVRSSHSVDIIERSCSKCAVIASVGKGIAHGERILKIGDRGRWPGNDSELLEMELALSVDETSTARSTGWNLLPPGLSGSTGAARYLACIESGRFHPDRLIL